MGRASSAVGAWPRSRRTTGVGESSKRATCVVWVDRRRGDPEGVGVVDVTDRVVADV